MIDIDTLNLVCVIWSAIAIGTFVLLNYVTAPYGRHIKKGWGLEVSNKLGWVLMELPSFGIMLYFYLTTNQSNYAVMLSLLWLVHYFNRTFIFPFRLRTKGKKMPIIIVLSAIGFNFINAGLNGYYLGYLEQYTPESFMTWSFYLGATFFISGFIINQVSDHILINLRKPGETGYKIPKGFLFNYVSCPNHFGELTQWAGFALMAWSFPGTTFFIWTFANLVPRVLKHHKWYKSHFKDYPVSRKAFIPKIW